MSDGTNNTDKTPPLMPQLHGLLESLAEEVEGWAAHLGVAVVYTDPVLSESGRHEWAAGLRKQVDWAVRTAGTLLTAGGKAELAEDLKRRVEELCAAAEGYEQRLEALEDQRRVHIEGIVARYRQVLGAEDPDAFRLMGLCQGIQRVWTSGIEDHSPGTPEEFAEAIDRAWFEEDGAKRRAQVEIKRRTSELVEHLRLLAGIEAEQRAAVQHVATPPAPTHDAKAPSKRGQRGPARMSLEEAWRYLAIVQEWTTIQEGNKPRLLRDRVQKVQIAERYGLTVKELNAMLAWYAKHQRAGRFPEDPRTLSRGELEKWFE